MHAKYVSFLVLLLMTQLILVDYDLEEKTAKFAYGTRLAEWTVRGCCGVQLALTLWYLYIWLRLRLPLALKQYDKHSSKGQQ